MHTHTMHHLARRLVSTATQCGVSKPFTAISKRGFRAAVAEKNEDKSISVHVRHVDSTKELPFQVDGSDVTVDVAYSCLNYKDGMVLTGRPGVAKQYPIVPGIDFTGTVVDSKSDAWSPGHKVVLTGHYAGQHMDGGYAERATTRSDWLVPLPSDFSELESQILGTAGYTAMVCVMRLEAAGVLQRGAMASDDEVLVTGAAGGVGSVAVAILSHLGYNVVASTGRAEQEEGYLKSLGASSVVGRLEQAKPLDRERWAGVVDTVGGDTLANALATTRYNGGIAACGVASGPALNTTVFPFILRNVKLLGADSVQAPMSERQAVWESLAKDLPRSALSKVYSGEVATLEDLPELGPAIIAGAVKGRVVIDPRKQ